MRAEQISVKCRCGYEHTNTQYIKFVRDRLNKPKNYCSKCGRRIFVHRFCMKVTSDKRILIS